MIRAKIQEALVLRERLFYSLTWKTAVMKNIDGNATFEFEWTHLPHVS